MCIALLAGVAGAVELKDGAEFSTDDTPVVPRG